MSETEPRFYSHNSVYEPEGDGLHTYSWSEIRDRYLSGIEDDGFVATDMDGTMFRNDLGIHVFLEKLSQSPEWSFDPDEFSQLLVPPTYEVILDLAEAGEVKHITPEDATRYKQLRDDCIDLYAAIYAEEHEDLTIDHPLVNEFARKMLELDRMGMAMEYVFIKGMKGQLLSRTRFFVGQNPRMLAKLTESAMMSHQNGGRVAHLKVHPKNSHSVNQRITADDLEPMDYDKQVVVVKDVRYLIDQLFNDGQGTPVRVVTTNLAAIARGALRNSCYRPLLDQECDGKSPVMASKLEHNAYGKMGKSFRKLPILGEVKSKVLRELQPRIKRKVKVAVGDSVSNDSPMMSLALENGGIAVIVGKVYEETREKFKTVIDGEDGMRRRLHDAKIGDRIFYIEDKD